MNKGNVKRFIEIEEIRDDIFSDEIKTTALIEEIEAAEAAARQANIDKQIESSQPTKLQKLQGKLSEKVAELKTGVSERVAELKEKKPVDPRVEKVSLKKKLTKKVERAERAKKAPKIKIKPVKQPRLAELASRINALAPQGVAKKSVVELSIVAALVVTGVEIWAWDLSHPLFSNGETEISVPVTGKVENGETDDDSPFADVEAASEKAEEKAENDGSGNSENTGATNTSTSGSRTYSAGAQSQTKTASNTTKTTTKSYSGAVSGSTYVDGSWNDNYDSDWPTYEEPDPVEPVDDTPEQPDEGDTGAESGEDSEE